MARHMEQPVVRRQSKPASVKTLARGLPVRPGLCNLLRAGDDHRADGAVATFLQLADDTEGGGAEVFGCGQLVQEPRKTQLDVDLLDGRAGFEIRCIREARSGSSSWSASEAVGSAQWDGGPDAVVTMRGRGAPRRWPG